MANVYPMVGGLATSLHLEKSMPGSRLERQGTRGFISWSGSTRANTYTHRKKTNINSRLWFIRANKGRVKREYLRGAKCNGVRSPKFIWAPVYSCTQGLHRDVVYRGWPIAPSYMSPNAGEGGCCRVSANEYSCIHRSLNKLWKCNSIFNLWLYSLAQTPQPPSPLLMGSNTRALLVSQDRRHLFGTPWFYSREL